MDRFQPDSLQLMLRRSLLRLNAAVCTLRGYALCEQDARMAVEAAYGGRRWPGAPDYGRLAGQHYERVAMEVVGDLDVEGRTVLDIGSGVGILACQLLAAGAARIICVDLCGCLLEPCQARISRAGFSQSDCQMLQAHAAALPLPDASIDVIVSSLALAQVPQLDVVAVEMLRLLRPGGMLSLAIEGATCLAELQDAVIRELPLRFLLGRTPAFWPMTSREAHHLCRLARLSDISIRHAYWQDQFDSPDEAFDFALAASAGLLTAAVPERDLPDVNERIRRHFTRRQILKLTQDVVYIRGARSLA